VSPSRTAPAPGPAGPTAHVRRAGCCADPKKVPQLTSFTDLKLNPALLKALEGEGYTTPTPIQAQAIPFVMEGRDLLGIAQTGTGKTAAFALPIMHRLAANPRPALRKGCRCLILSPTRELASQIAESFRTYGRHLGIKVAVVFGGVAHRPQIQAMAQGVDVLVATPGRLIDHMMERNVQLEGTEIFVLDEADQMLDLGFVVPIRRIVQKLAARRQNLFFSATMPKEIGRLADELLQDPAKVSVAQVATTAERVAQQVIHIEAGKKRALLTEMFADPAMSRTLVFTRTKRGADKVAQHLERAGIRVAAIHGNKSQRQREEALAAFKASKIRALIATDIAARGIDIDLVTHVVNFELPNVPEAYVHRIGRTARAGAEGIAISFCAGDERSLLKDIEKLTRQIIQSTDRRNDVTLAADAASSRSDDSGDYRDPRRSGGRPAGGGDRGGRSGGGGRGGNGGGGFRGGERREGGSGNSNGYRADARSEPRRDSASTGTAAPRAAASTSDARPGWRPALDADRAAEHPARAERPRTTERGRENNQLGNVAFLSRPDREAAHRTTANKTRRPESRDSTRGSTRPAEGGQRPARSADRRDGRKAF
jgi:ATP-dependent RNA helicase RhlE